MPEMVGSSPRVRGTAEIGHRACLDRRFIPACAGNSQQRPHDLFAVAVHPRVCGEQVGGAHGMGGCSGSSPRVRGTGGGQRRPFPDQRFIPACAGNRPRQNCSRPCRTVHPRVCGEQARSAASSASQFGSSPRVRGTVIPAVILAVFDRFIPACAGNRVFSVQHRAAITVHPRVCGEQDLAFVVRRRVAGSSPRVRGTAR